MTLTIEDGVQVRLNNGIGIDVSGTLTAVGTPGTGILFTRNGTSLWYAMNFQGTGTGTFDHCTIEFASYGIYADGTGTVSVANTILRNHSYGVYAIERRREPDASTTVTGNTELWLLRHRRRADAAGCEYPGREQRDRDLS